MKATEIPKGVRFSFLMMSTPLLLTTGYLALLAPMISAGTGVVDPAQFAYLARTCMRILALNISFMVSISFINFEGRHPLWSCLCNIWDRSDRRRTEIGLVLNDLFICASCYVLLTYFIPVILHTFASAHCHICLHWPHDDSANDPSSGSSVCRERTCS